MRSFRENPDSEEARRMTAENESVSLLPIGAETRFGKIGMVGFTGGERYYWMIDKRGCVSMMPACVVEKCGA